MLGLKLGLGIDKARGQIRYANKFLCRQICRVVCLFISTSLVSAHVTAKEYFVESQQQYNEIASTLAPGDNVVLKNGVWTDFEILLEGEGNEDKPIVLRAQTSGQVTLTGQSNLRLAGKYLQVSGLVFRDGYTPSSSVIEFRKDKDTLASYSQVSEIVIDDFNNPDKQESDYWVAFYGKHNRLNNSALIAKRNKGVTVAVRMNTKESQENYHKIDHNYFGYRPIFGSNGGETLRIGTSHYSLEDSFTLVENNIFERTNGEVEIISVKSGKNTLRGNLFYEARGTLTMRHGNGNMIVNNVFLGNDKPHTGGIRVINKDQVIQNNYLSGLTGYRFGSGFTILNGVPNSPINRYHQVDNATITNNSFINVKHFQLAAGSDAERSAVPINSKIQNNLIVNQDGQHPFTIFDDVSGIKFVNNVATTTAPKSIAYGIEKKAIELKQAVNGLLYPVESLDVGASKALSVIDSDKVGPSWFTKPTKQIAFNSGKTHLIDTDAAQLVSAIEQAQSGDIIELRPGATVVPKLLFIDKTLTIKAQKAGESVLSYERTALFEIQDNGNLNLDGLSINGKESPDAHGNSVIRTKKWGMVNNYRLIVENSTFEDLDINHSFHFFATGKGAFADEITLKNNRFFKVSGDILRLDAEIEDLGIYNAEYVNLYDNRFDDVRGALVKLYRGGTDESTFGPQLVMKNNQLNNVGSGKRNKTKSSIYLHGVQVTNIENNQIMNAAPIVVEHTVGEPQTRIADNTFMATDAPSIKELRVSGPHTAVLSNNEVK